MCVHMDARNLPISTSPVLRTQRTPQLLVSYVGVETRASPHDFAVDTLPRASPQPHKHYFKSECGDDLSSRVIE